MQFNNLSSDPVWKPGAPGRASGQASKVPGERQNQHLCVQNLHLRSSEQSAPLQTWRFVRDQRSPANARGRRLGRGLLVEVAENKMPLLNIVVALVVIGLALWLINNFIPMASSIKSILNVVVVVAVGVWLLQAFGLWGHVTHYRFH
jgi:hypothetical protein